jgi:exopolyphosphatase/pppGpp-phosphohydrolase
MKLYAAIDLHSNNSVLVILDERSNGAARRLAE